MRAPKGASCLCATSLTSCLHIEFDAWSTNSINDFVSKEFNDFVCEGSPPRVLLVYVQHRTSSLISELPSHSLGERVTDCFGILFKNK